MSISIPDNPAPPALAGISTRTQLTAARTLAALLAEHPDLPAAEWTISDISGHLCGRIYYGGIAELAQYARTLGGTPVADLDFSTSDGCRMRRHILTVSVWDVPITVSVAVPLSAQVTA